MIAEARVVVPPHPWDDETHRQEIHRAAERVWSASARRNVSRNEVASRLRMLKALIDQARDRMVAVEYRRSHV